jgi:cation diffusion facilitator CzcD-associated flavoprotein CzcO
MPTYPSAEQMTEYLRLYADHFALHRHFRFDTEILLVSPAGEKGHESWTIKLRDSAGQMEETFDKVLVTSGPWGKPFMPHVPGAEDFMGEITHAQAYKE